MKCPVCRAENALELNCRRCKADLSLMVALETRRRGVLAEAMQCVRSGDGEGALHAARLAHELRPGADSWRLLAVAQLLRRDYRQALHNRDKAK